MAATDGNSEEEVVKLEKAVSDRSTCRASGEKIQKGEWRVGIMAWRSGRNTMTWQKALPFLKNCLLEKCEKANAGTCKLTGHKFSKGEARFVCSTGDKRVFLTIPSAAKIIQPVIDAVAGSFTASNFKGLDEIDDSDVKEVAKQFGLSQAALAKRAAEMKQEDEKEDAPSSKKRGSAAKHATPVKRQKRGKAAPKKEEWEEEEAEEEEDEEEEELEEEMEAEVEEAAEVEEGSGDEEDVKGEADQEEEEVEEGDSGSEEDIPDYEKQRQAIIARNQARIRELGLKELAAEIMPPAKPKPKAKKGISTKKKAAPEGPRRTSLRQRGVAADGQMINKENRNGTVVVAMPKGGQPKSTAGQATEPEEPLERHPKGEIAFDSGNEDKAADESFLALLRESAAAGKQSKTSGKTALHKLSLREEDVAKVTDNGISHIQWHPSAATPVVAAADKSGNVGLWSVDHPSDGPGDGVLSFKPHNSYVSGLKWAGSGKAPVKLFSCSYDGSIRLLDAVEGRFDLAVSTEEAEFSAFDCSRDGNVAIAGDNDGCVRVYDVRENRGTVRDKPTEIHNRRVNTLQFSYGEEHLFLSSSADNSLAVWDMRKLNGGGSCKPVAKAAHPKTCQSAYFAPDDTDRVVTLSRDDTIKVWQFDRKSRLNEIASMNHHNNTGRWILPFRATWSPAADAIIVGNMKRSVDIYSPEGKLLGKLQSEHMTAISSRAAVHPSRGLLAAATASGRIHVFR